jgi:hypothetical protein
MAESKSWIITTTGDRPIKEVAKELTDSGFDVGQVLDEIGCITGAANEDVAAHLRNIRGVADVSPDQPIDIGPPDSPTW